MKNTNEEQILKIIKYTPPIFIIFASICITLFLYFENKNTFLEEKKRIEQEYIQANKKNIKDEVNRVYNFIKNLQKTTEIELKKNIKSRVYEAHSIATNIYNKYKNTKSKEEIFKLIKTALSAISFNDNRGYFFIDDIHGKKLVYPVDKNIEGKTLLDYEDANGYKFIQTIVETIKNKSERFDEYYWYKPLDKTNTYKKISFYKYFEPFNVAIGTGEYFDDFEKKIQKQALEYINLVRYGENGYIFVLDYDSIYLSHIRTDYIGKDAIENNDTVEIKNVIDNVISISKQGYGYYSYIQNKKPGTNLPTKKISFIKGLNDWKWVIGSGFYEDDILSEIEKRKEQLNTKFDNYIHNIFIISLMLTLSLLFISAYISRILESKFNDYKKDINTQQSILSQQSKMAAMGEMIGNIAHQWRQPLSTITTASTGMVLQKELGNLSDDFFFEASNKINASAQHLSKTIDDFRNFFSPNKVKTKFLLKNTFSTTLDLIQAQFRTKDIKIIKHIENIEIYAYENELIQALINILNNARDELIKKGEDKEKLIFIDVSKKDDKAIISIKDNAGGIPIDVIDRIFEPYFTTKHKRNGTGVGLYMCEEIITRHMKGSIKVKNIDFKHEKEIFKGALFKLSIPIK